MVVRFTLLSALRNSLKCPTLLTCRRFQAAGISGLPFLAPAIPRIHFGVSGVNQVQGLCRSQTKSAHQKAFHLFGLLEATAPQPANLQTLQSLLGCTTSRASYCQRTFQVVRRAAQGVSSNFSKHTSPSMTLSCCGTQRHLAGFSGVAPSSTLDLVSKLVAERAALARGRRGAQLDRCLIPGSQCRSPFSAAKRSTVQKNSQGNYAALAAINEWCSLEAPVGQSPGWANSPLMCNFSTHPIAFGRQLSGQSGRQLSDHSGRQLSGPSTKMSATTKENLVVLSDGSAGSSGGVLEANVLKALEEKLGSPIDHGPSVPPAKPLVIIISGPSGVGKDAVIKRLQERRPELHMVVTATSRPARKGEVHGKDYFFITKDAFQDMIDRDELLEHALVYGDFKGIPKQQVRETMDRGTDVVLRIDVQGAATIRAMLGSGGVFIFLAAESEAALVRRLVERKTESLEKALLRLETARAESKRMGDFDYVVVNADGQLDRTVDMIASIIDAEKARVHPREPKL